MKERLIITICGRAGSKGFANKNLKTFCGRPLVHYSLSAIQLFLQSRQDLEADVVLNTDSDALRSLVLDSYPWVVYLPRPQELAGDRVGKAQVFRHSILEMEQRNGRPYDYHMDLDITSPLRTVADVAGTLDALRARPDLDLVMSAAHSRRNPFMNMGMRVGEYIEPVIRTDVVARQQAPECFDINASIYAFRPDFLKNSTTGYVWDGKCGVYLMEDTGVLDIDSEEDFLLLEVIGRHLYETRPAFAQVRENIRGAGA